MLGRVQRENDDIPLELGVPYLQTNPNAMLLQREFTCGSSMLTEIYMGFSHGGIYELIRIDLD